MKKIRVLFFACLMLLSACGKQYTVEECKVAIKEFLLADGFTEYGTTSTKEDGETMLVYDESLLGFGSVVEAEKPFSYMLMIDFDAEHASYLYGRTDSGVPVKYDQYIEGFPGTEEVFAKIDEVRQITACKRYVPEFEKNEEVTIEDLFKEIEPKDTTVKL